MNAGPVKQPPMTPADQPGRDWSALPVVPAPLTVDSQSLLQGQRSLTIAHQGVSYRLQLTRQGKLILTK